MSAGNPYRTYRVQARDRAPLIEWMERALMRSGCRIIRVTPPTQAPFRLTFELPSGERRGIVAYAFLANNKLTKNRPPDEHRFQVKYGSDDKAEHELWQDEFGLYTTLFLGINLDRDFFVAADPVLHGTTRFFKSIEFKDADVDALLTNGWHAWERKRRGEQEDGRPRRAAAQHDDPVSVLVGGTSESFLRLVLFERAAHGLDQGHRQLLAEHVPELVRTASISDSRASLPDRERLHDLAEEFDLPERELLDLIAGAPRLKMAVRGWVAEEHLVRALEKIPGISEAVRLRDEGGPDISVRFEGSRPLLVECKNVLRQRTASGLARLDFQRTRSSKSDECSRYYRHDEFDVIAACLHAVTERWDFSYAIPGALERHVKCPEHLSHRVRIDERWTTNVRSVLERAAG